MSPISITAYLVLFAVAGFLFLFGALLLGRFLRPSAPSPQKLQAYECGEPAVGSSFIQFDLRFYVVALVFLIFEVELAFFFPWAVVFGKAVEATQPEAAAIVAVDNPATPAPAETETEAEDRITTARQIARAAMVDIGVFFGVLLVGFAYVWWRGDLNWILRHAAVGDVLRTHSNGIPMEFAAILDRVKQLCGDAITGAVEGVVDPWIEVVPECLGEVAETLRDDAQLRFDMLNLVTGVDYFEPNEKKAAKVDWEPHVEVIYHMWSLEHKHRLVLKVTLPRWKDNVEGQLPEVPTLSDVYPAADWHERETYDLVGVRFTGHGDLRRILCPEDWEGHPLRKDYELPDDYHGIPTR